ncbi:MAG: GAF domain-containing protein [Candidatus Omnitrophica bacterium]|nr:GAF domain-containing protein [Candidatus Omnitrophota bacterium]
MGLFTKTEQDENTQVEALQKVNEICALVTTVLNEQDLLEQSLQQTMRLFGATRASVFILGENGKDLIMRCASGMQRAEQEKMVKKMGEGIVGHVARRKLPIVVDDIENDARFHDFKARKSYRTPSFICAPLMIKDKLLGVVNIADKGSGLCFTQNEMQLLDFLSTQIALNYRRIELYQKFKIMVRETRTLKDRLGQSDQEAKTLKKQVHINERLATIGKLAGGIAHEFNNPLDGVIRYTNLCLEHTKDDEVVRGYLLEIKHGLNRMANIVKNLLACSRNEFQPGERVSFQQILERSLASVHTEVEHKNIKIERKIEENIPPLRDLGLEHILTNILRNAVEATGPSGGKITIEAQCQEKQLQIKIRDTGAGIPSAEIEKIFEPFYTTKAMDKGCGLGLTIVAEIIKSYGGKIRVESEPGDGTLFLIALPLQQ